MLWQPNMVNDSELKRAQGIMGRLNGYLPHRWPNGGSPARSNSRTALSALFPGGARMYTR